MTTLQTASGAVTESVRTKPQEGLANVRAAQKAKWAEKGGPVKQKAPPMGTDLAGCIALEVVFGPTSNFRNNRDLISSRDVASNRVAGSKPLDAVEARLT
jgi:hypothetical protein